MKSDSIQEQYENVCRAISKIEKGAQSYRIGSRSVTRADLNVLYAQRDRLRTVVQTEELGTNSSTVFAEFLGR